MPSGSARGWEPVTYVENIRNYRDILRWLESRVNGEPEPEPTENPDAIADAPPLQANTQT